MIRLTRDFLDQIRELADEAAAAGDYVTQGIALLALGKDRSDLPDHVAAKLRREGINVREAGAREVMVETLGRPAGEVFTDVEYQGTVTYRGKKYDVVSDAIVGNRYFVPHGALDVLIDPHMDLGDWQGNARNPGPAFIPDATYKALEQKFDLYDPMFD